MHDAIILFRRTLLALCLSLTTSLVMADDQVDFARDIRPILSDKCFFCHGPDEGERQADLRLDQEESAKEHVIVPGNIKKSELIARILSDDEDEKMPPEDSGKSLSPREVALLTRWVEQGAPWAGHWSFEAPTKPIVPKKHKKAPKEWRDHPIDRFVFPMLRDKGLKPTERAEKSTLIRRVTLDLTGLPPTLEEIDAYLADDKPDAFGRVVDRLLASDAYAERMTLAWMDAARYGDTSVMHADGPRYMWPWRDWVIKAYKNNKPFDEFLLEQLAGDFLPDATTEQKLATGFLRNNASSDEGGAFPEELRVEYVVDRVKTTFNVFQGLSAECAQCHSHKYDPISHEEYYALFAFFNNSADPGMQTRNGNQTPIVRVHSADTIKFLADKQAEIAAAKKSFDEAMPDKAELDAWIGGFADDKPTTFAAGWHELADPIAVTDLDKAWKSQPIATDQAIVVDKPVTVDEEERKWTARGDWRDKGKVTVQSRKDTLHYITVDLNATNRVAGEFRLKNAHAYQVFRGKDKVHETGPRGDKKTVEAKFRLLLNKGSNRLLIKLASRHDNPFEQEWSFSPQAAPENLRKLAAKTNGDDKASLSDDERKQLVNHFKNELWPEGREKKNAIAGLEGERKKREESSTSCMVMEDLAKVRPTYILDRGQYDSPKKDRVIEPDTPEALGKLGDDYPHNRLGLAQWMIRDDHPLTARVAVNRYWYLLFGRGLVDTVMDFGGQGSTPTHPALLDWLATDFRDHGWDVKRTLKQIVMSETYQQAPKFSKKASAADPKNLYLSRGSRFRLQGDFIRDQALAVSGLLVPKVGGPGVKPYQPDGLWNEVSLNKGLRFKQDHGEALYRRSMYIYWKRSAPHPSMSIFDAPTREKCTVARPRTNTPLQALVTLNDVQFVEASRKLAERIMKDGGDDFVTRLDYAYRMCTSRSPRASEVTVCEAVYEKQLGSFWDDDERAKQYLDYGESKRDESLPLAEHAAWAVVANMLLNLDEVLMRN